MEFSANSVTFAGHVQFKRNWKSEISNLKRIDDNGTGNAPINYGGLAKSVQFFDESRPFLCGKVAAFRHEFFAKHAVVQHPGDHRSQPSARKMANSIHFTNMVLGFSEYATASRN
ncbi:MAG: hypothetical protein JWM11_3218 [Planctomycetaceae bacterium]|nr:hypothetical protein [Planctomycetaceae bacterium]